MWALLALKSQPSPAMVTAQNRAHTFLATAATGQSTEWHAARLLLHPHDESVQEVLLKLQHPDGSWGWLAAEPGDAYGTGLALYALAKCQPKASSRDAVKRAIRYLNDTQRPDGSWLVPSTRGRDKNKPIPTSIYWGTAWAVVSLLEWDNAALSVTAPCSPP